MSPTRPLAAVYEAQPIIDAMILAFQRDDLDAKALSVENVIDILNRHFSHRPSKLAVSEAFDEGSRLGAWTLIGRTGERNHIEVSQTKIAVLAEALGSQTDSVFYALKKVGGEQFKASINRARQKSEEDSVEFPNLNSLQAPIKRLEHNQVFQRGLAATRKTSPLPSAETKGSSSKSGVDWTRSGAIAGWIGIALAFVAAVTGIIALIK